MIWYAGLNATVQLSPSQYSLCRFLRLSLRSGFHCLVFSGGWLGILLDEDRNVSVGSVELRCHQCTESRAFLANLRHEMIDKQNVEVKATSSLPVVCRSQIL